VLSIACEERRLSLAWATRDGNVAGDTRAASVTVGCRTTVRRSVDQRNTAAKLAAIRRVYAKCLANGEPGAVACFMVKPGNSGNDPVRWSIVWFETGVSPRG